MTFKIKETMEWAMLMDALNLVLFQNVYGGKHRVQAWIIERTGDLNSEQELLEFMMSSRVRDFLYDWEKRKTIGLYTGTVGELAEKMQQIALKVLI